TAGSFAASIITTAWDRREALHQGHLSAAIGAGGTGTPLGQAMASLTQLGMNQAAAAAAITRQLTNQAYLLATTDLFRLSAWICAAAILVVWFARRPSAPSGPVAAD